MKLAIKIFGTLLLFVLAIAFFLAAYINWFDAPTYEVTKAQIKYEPTQGNIELGEKIALNFCASCHLSSDGDFSGKIMLKHKTWGTISTGNLTKHPNAILSSYSDSDLFTFLKTGIKNDNKMAFPMMPKLAAMSDDDLNSLIAFLRSDHPLLNSKPTTTPKSEPSFLVKALMKFMIKPIEGNGDKITTPLSKDRLAYGAYLVNGRYSCFTCHSRHAEKLDYLKPTSSPGYLGGGANIMAYGNRIGIKSANITPHPETGIGKWTFEDFKEALINGKRPDGKALRPPMNQMKLDSIEVISIWAYLKTISPNANHWEYNSRIEMPED